MRDSVGSYRIIDLDLSKYDRLASRFDLERKADVSFLKAGIETRNAPFNRLMEQLEHVAIHSDAPILLAGPTGAGKTQLARRVYELKKRRSQITGNFVELNCATLRGDQTMSALFGHTKGAFTGAEKDRAGLLRAADGGMLFLDEIGELGADEQAMLLRAVEEGRFLPVGADQEVHSTFQLLAGTNRDLVAEVSQGAFREDLLARINLWTFRLPGLVDRREDIAPNLQFELDSYASRTGTQVRFNIQARKRFLQFAISHEAVWKGNFRDLTAAVTRMATLSPTGRINEDIVQQEIERLRSGWTEGPPEAGEAIFVNCLAQSQLAELDLFDRLQLASVLRVCQEAPSLSAAGRELYQQSRLKKASSNDADRLRKYLARFWISWADI